MAKVLVAFAITLYIGAVIFAMTGSIIADRRLRKYRSENGYEPFDFKIPYRIVDFIYDTVRIGIVSLGIWFVVS
jgi:hypothetical protein